MAEDELEDDERLDPVERVRLWTDHVSPGTPPAQLPIALRLNPFQRGAAVLIAVLAMAGALGTLHYVSAASFEPLVGVAVCVGLLLTGIGLSVSTVTVDHDEFTEVGAWRIETVPLTSVVGVRHSEDTVALVTGAGVIWFIGPLGDGGSNTLTHGLPEGTTAAGVAAAVEQARRVASDRPDRATRQRIPPGYKWVALAAVILLGRAHPSRPLMPTGRPTRPSGRGDRPAGPRGADAQGQGQRDVGDGVGVAVVGHRVPQLERERRERRECSAEADADERERGTGGAGSHEQAEDERAGDVDGEGAGHRGAPEPLPHPVVGEVAQRRADRGADGDEHRVEGGHGPGQTRWPTAAPAPTASVPTRNVAAT